MRIGIVSDSHGKGKRLQSALEILASRGVEAIVHCGDFGSTECLELIGRAAAPVYAVSGNMDRRIEKRLHAVAAELGVTFSTDFVELPIGSGQCLAVTHGHDEQMLSELVNGGRFRYVCHGHTHRPRDERVGAVRVINPGALRRCRAPAGPSAAVLDTASDRVEHISIPR